MKMIRLLSAILIVAINTKANATADGPDYWQVTGIQAGHTLNIRKGPSINFSVVGTLPHDANRLQNLGCFPEFTAFDWQQFNTHEKEVASAMRWCRIEYGSIHGWVYGKYLTEY